ncbi:hypothetical protein AO843_09165 [Lysinibacillus sp. ZYM-1]|nr:hypothetical protein AO843_09165 [Lysinibacillus sp. ZYM-1]
MKVFLCFLYRMPRVKCHVNTKIINIHQYRLYFIHSTFKKYEGKSMTERHKKVLYIQEWIIIFIQILIFSMYD